MINYLLNHLYKRGDIPKRGTPNLPLQDPEVKKFLDLYGLEPTKSDDGETVMLVPKGMAAGARGDNMPTGFHQYWMEQAWVKHEQEVEKFRDQRYDYYRFMDENSTESSLMLDTYADEATATPDLNDSPLKISINNREAQAKVLDILTSSGFISTGQNNIISPHRSHMRELAKYGDYFVRYMRPKPKSDDIRIQALSYDVHKVQVVREAQTGKTIAYQIGQADDILPPWEITHGKIKDSSFEPYGRSILEPVRSAYQQLMITEALLALSRASRVERLVIKVPTTHRNPTAAFQNLMQLKASLKSIIFGDNNTAQSKSRIPALTDILFMPSGDGYEIDNLQGSIDVSSIDDVEFFRDKFITGSRMPKSYFLADDTIALWGDSLAQQDLKFARALLPLQDSYIEFLSQVVVSLLILLNYDLGKVKARIEITRPQAIHNDVISRAKDALDLVESLVTFYREQVGASAEDTADDHRVSEKAWIELVSKVTGLPKSTLKLLKAPPLAKVEDDAEGSKVSENRVIASRTSDQALMSMGYSAGQMTVMQKQGSALLLSEMNSVRRNEVLETIKSTRMSEEME